MLRALKQTLWAPGPRGPTETETELCLSVSCGDVGHWWTVARAGALGATEMGMAQALLEEIAFNLNVEPPELTQDWGNRLLKGTNRTWCTPGPRRKEQ